MRDFARYLSRGWTINPASQRLLPPLSALRRRLGLLKWLVPAGLMLIVAIYELGPARWILNALGARYHLVAEILVYGTLGPALAFVLLDLLGRWLEERETSELQAKVLAQAREHVRVSRQLNDDALQTLFAASLLLDTIESGARDLPPGVAVQLQAAARALDRAIQQLHAELLKQPPPE